MHFLGPKWGLQVIAWSDLMGEIKRFSSHWSHVHYLTVDAPHGQPGELDDLMTTPEFWSMINGDIVLFFDAESLLCSNRVERFVEYDYIGSPWASGKSFSPFFHVGDGGLSLRRKHTIKSIASENDRRNMIVREDVFFSLHLSLSEDQHTLPSFETARDFSVECVYCPKPFGLHRPWACLPTDRIHDLLSTIRY